MQLNEVAILAMTGSCLVEGDFRLVSGDAAARDLIRPEGARIAAALGRAPLRSILSLVGEVRQDPDGFYSAGPPALDLALGYIAMPSLEDVLANMGAQAEVEFRRSGGGLARVQAKHPAAGEGPFDWIAGSLQSLKIEAIADDAGLRLTLEGELGPMTTHKVEGPVLADARLSADVVIPWAYLRVQESQLAWLESRVRQRSEGGRGQFEFGPTLAGVALHQAGGTPYLQGELTFGRSGWPFDRRQPCVEARIAEHSLTLQAASAPLRTTDGFVRSSGGGGPQMTLFELGYAGWSQMLQHADTASLQLKGRGIGFVDQFTGRDVGDVGGSMRQPVEACRIDLECRPEGLALAVEGELGEIQADSVFKGSRAARSLGASFKARMLLPTAYILARNLPVPRYREKRVRALQPA